MKKVIILLGICLALHASNGPDLDTLLVNLNETLTDINNLLTYACPAPLPLKQKPIAPQPIPQKPGIVIPNDQLLKATGLLPLKRKKLDGSEFETIGDRTIDMFPTRQINVVDQFALSMKTGLGFAACGILALYNVLNMNGFFKTGDKKYLENLLNENLAETFVREFYLQWADKGEIEQKITNIKNGVIKTPQLNYLTNFATHISVIPTPIPLNENDKYHNEIQYATLTPNELKRIKQELLNLKNQKEYYYSFIIGNFDKILAQGNLVGHWYAISFIKKNGEKRAIVMDSAGGGYHLDEHARDTTNYNNYMRLYYLIEYLINLQPDLSSELWNFHLIDEMK